MINRFKYCFFLFLFVGFLFIPVLANGTEKVLEKKIYIGFSEEPISDMLNELGKATGVYFSYNSNIIPDHITYTIPEGEYTIGYLLERILSKNVYTLETFHDHIIIQKKEMPGHEPIIKQKDIDMLLLQGKIIDQDNENPVPFAHVFAENKYTGTITNQEGEFTLNIPYDDNGKLTVSFMGYQEREVSIRELAANNYNIIKINPQSFQLNAIKVIPYDAEKIVRTALKNIDKNYTIEPYMCTGFYRESNKIDGHYTAISETVLSIYKTTYKLEYIKDKIKIIRARKVENQQAINDYEVKVMGGINNTFKLDIVKYRPSFVNLNYINHYNYKFEKVTNLDNRKIFIIRFDQKDWVKKPFYKGRIYIDQNNYAILRADFQISPKGIEHAAEHLIRKRPLGKQVIPYHTLYSVCYQEINGKYHLNNARLELKVKVNNKRINKRSYFTTISEFIITNRYNTPAVEYAYSETIHEKEILIDKIKSTDPTFWGKYNIIKPEQPLEDAYKQLVNNHGILIVNQ